jgi:Flp pilus assembly protein TadG
MIYGLFQVGLLYQANAGMQHALGEGARLATLYERYTANNVPTDAAIKSRMTTKLFGKGDGAFTVADPVTGAGYKDLSITYTKKMNFIFFNGPTVTLTRSKRAYTVS